MIAEFRIPLNLPGVEVLSTEITEGGRLELIETFGFTSGAISEN
jgi:hypothetical protein